VFFALIGVAGELAKEESVETKPGVKAQFDVPEEETQWPPCKYCRAVPVRKSREHEMREEGTV
jgi:hypothetical protein